MGRVCVIGEPLAELSFGSDGALRLGLGGDAANVAVRLARVGCEVSLHTALGTDALSERIARRFREEGVELAGPILVGERVGIYLVATDASGDRSFTYWRDGSAAFRYLHDQTQQLLAEVGEVDVIHLSGITLALVGQRGRETLLARIARLRAAGTFVVFDPNHRAALWPDARAAASATDDVLASVDAVLASRDDCAALFGSRDAEAGARSLAAGGIPHVAVTDAAAGCVIADAGATTRIEAPVVPHVVDTTGAGDAFDAAWILAFLRGDAPVECARAGLEAAAACVAYPGALD
jgi:2-dehydro-3-deoxygluconokinase